MTYRGRNAAAHYQSRRIGPGGALGVRVPGTSDIVTVVSQYKHLGGVTEVGGNNVPEARARSVAAAESYSPLAVRVYGNVAFPLECRWSLMRSLVFSRLFFNLHIRVLTIAAMRVVNTMYMRCIRRLAGACRFGESDSDYEVRR